jgi:hypothetical protein
MLMSSMLRWPTRLADELCDHEWFVERVEYDGMPSIPNPATLEPFLCHQPCFLTFRHTFQLPTTWPKEPLNTRYADIRANCCTSSQRPAKAQRQHTALFPLQSWSSSRRCVAGTCFGLEDRRHTAHTIGFLAQRSEPILESGVPGMPLEADRV